MASSYRITASLSQVTRLQPGVLSAVGVAIVLLLCQQRGLAQSLPLPVAARVAAAHAPAVNPGTLLAFAFHESQLRPFAIHDNTTGQTAVPVSATSATALARALLARGHSLDLGIMQVNSTNLERTGLTTVTAFDAGESLRAGASILVAAFRQCLHGRVELSGAVEQAALRCAASIYNTGREQAGILNGYQPGVWRAAAEIVPAIEAAAITPRSYPAALGGDVVAPQPRRSPSGLEDALHAAPLVPEASDSLSDALHHPTRKDAP
jgi:type IV secretion system protein VirB1